MDRRGMALTAVLGLGLAALLSWLVSPTTDVSPAPAHPVPTSRDEAPHRPIPSVRSEAPPVRPSVQTPSVSPAPRTDHANVLPPTTEGLATAALYREEAVAACLAREVEQGRPLEGRPTIQLTVHDAGDVGVAEIMLVGTTVHHAEAEACLAKAFADAVWEVPAHGETTVSWRAPR